MMCVSTENDFKPKNFLLIFNEEAGKGKPDQKKEEIISYLTKNNCNFTFIAVEKLDNTIDFKKFDAVVVAGGDGTVLKAIPYLANTGIKLGIIPCGTANLFASSLCIPFNMKKAIDILISGITTKVDIGKAGNEYFALRIGMGYDAEVVNGTGRALKKKLGYLAYFIQGIISSFRLSKKSYRISIDNKVINVRANSIIVANAGNMFRNMFTIAPLGSINDGKLDILIFLSKNFWDFLIIFFQILLGRHGGNSKVIYSQAKKIKIESRNEDTHIDGEPYLKSNLDISIIPKALMVVVP